MQINRALTLVACLLTFASTVHAEPGDANLGRGLGSLGSGLGGRATSGADNLLGGGFGSQNSERADDWRQGGEDLRLERSRSDDRGNGLKLRDGQFCPPEQARQGNC